MSEFSPMLTVESIQNAIAAVDMSGIHNRLNWFRAKYPLREIREIAVAAAKLHPELEGLSPVSDLDDHETNEFVLGVTLGSIVLEAVQQDYRSSDVIRDLSEASKNKILPVTSYQINDLLGKNAADTIGFWVEGIVDRGNESLAPKGFRTIIGVALGIKGEIEVKAEATKSPIDDLSSRGADPADVDDRPDPQQELKQVMDNSYDWDAALRRLEGR